MCCKIEVFLRSFPGRAFYCASWLLAQGYTYAFGPAPLDLDLAASHPHGHSGRAPRDAMAGLRDTGPGALLQRRSHECHLTRARHTLQAPSTQALRALRGHRAPEQGGQQRAASAWQMWAPGFPRTLETLTPASNARPGRRACGAPSPPQRMSSMSLSHQGAKQEAAACGESCGRVKRARTRAPGWEKLLGGAALFSGPGTLSRVLPTARTRVLC